MTFLSLFDQLCMQWHFWSNGNNFVIKLGIVDAIFINLRPFDAIDSNIIICSTIGIKLGKGDAIRIKL